MDKIILKEIALWSNIGLTAEERAEKQPLFVDLDLIVDLHQVGRTDEVAHSINYATVCKEVKRLAEKEYKTLEALAETIATNIKSSFHPEHIRVYIQKPGALARKGVKYAAVEIYR